MSRIPSRIPRMAARLAVASSVSVSGFTMLETGEELDAIHEDIQNFFVTAFAFSPDGNTLASARVRTTPFKLCGMREYRRSELRTLTGHTRFCLQHGSFSPDDNTLASGSGS